MKFITAIKNWITWFFTPKPMFDPSNPWQTSPEAAEFYKIDGPVIVNMKEPANDPLTRKVDEIILISNMGSENKAFEDYLSELELVKRINEIPVPTRQAVYEDFNRTMQLLDQDRSAPLADEVIMRERIKRFDRNVDAESDRVKYLAGTR